MEVVQDRIYGQGEVMMICGLSETALRVAIKAGTFPPRLVITPKRRGWRASEINAWLANLKSADGDGCASEKWTSNLKVSGDAGPAK